MFKAIASLVEVPRMKFYRKIVLTSGLFDADWYRLAYPYIVRDNIDPLTHFLRSGKQYGLSPSRAFDAARYLEEHEEARRSHLNPLLHYLKHGQARGLAIHEAPPSNADRILESGFFDGEWYLRRYPDVAVAGYPALLHYMVHGAAEGRSPGPDFDARWYLARYPDIAGIDPLLHFLEHGRLEGRSPLRMRKLAKPANETVQEAESIIGAIATPPRAVVFLPWLAQDSGSLLAAAAIRALAEQHGNKSVLVILADHDREEASHLLPAGVRVVSLSRINERLSQLERIELIDLLIRRLSPDVVLNVNSHCCWEAFRRHGRSLSAITRLYAMLTAADSLETGRGDDGSNLHLRQCLPHLAGIYCGSQSYIDSLTEQLGLPDMLRTRVVYLPQPAPRMQEVRRSRSAGKKLHVLWADRLMPQKNIDLLVRIAEGARRCEFHIWGRGSHALELRMEDLSRRSPNVHFHGPFDNFGELPLNEYDAFVCTAPGNGIPDAMLEASAAGLAVVSSRVGDVDELIDRDTGWLIGDLANPAPYIGALEAIANDPAEAARRAEAMQERLRRNHDWQTYREILSRKPETTGGLLSAASRQARQSA